MTLRTALLTLAGAVVLCSAQAEAQIYGNDYYSGYGSTTTCSTSSRGQSFTQTSNSSEMARSSVVNRCVSNPWTVYSECTYNVRCSVARPIPQPGYPTPGYPSPGYPTPGYPVPVPPPTTRPSFPYGATVLSPMGRTWAYLPSCGGTVELNTYGRQVNIVFRDVRECSKFDILSAQGWPLNYGLKNLGGWDRARSGSFTLPQSVIDYGRNGVVVQIRSNSGRHADNIYLDFYAF